MLIWHVWLIVLHVSNSSWPKYTNQVIYIIKSFRITYFYENAMYGKNLTTIAHMHDVQKREGVRPHFKLSKVADIDDMVMQHEMQDVQRREGVPT